jgi:hypothetical protein
VRLSGREQVYDGVRFENMLISRFRAGFRVVFSNEEAVDLAGVIEGAIAIVGSEDVPEGLKVLKIDGLLPGEPGYPLEWNPVAN